MAATREQSLTNSRNRRDDNKEKEVTAQEIELSDSEDDNDDPIVIEIKESQSGDRAARDRFVTDMRLYNNKSPQRAQRPRQNDNKRPIRENPSSNNDNEQNNDKEEENQPRRTNNDQRINRPTRPSNNSTEDKPKDENNKDVDDEKKSENDDGDEDEDNAPDLFTFEFGELFGYWDEKSPSTTFVKAEFTELKDEVMNSKNDHKLDADQFQVAIEKATDLHNKMYKKDYDGTKLSPIYAKNKPYYNKLFGIKPGDPMSLEHVLAIILYTDYDDLQRYFKQQTRKTDRNENITDIAAKNGKYALWFKLLFECIWIFGDDLQFDEKVYHGINCRLLFNTFQYNFKAPISTSVNRNIAFEFCSRGNEGIILELSNGETYPQPYFDVQAFSRFSREEEYLFYGATLKIVSILTPNYEADNPNGANVLNYKPKVDALNFFMNIISGSEIERRTSTHSGSHKTHIKLLKKLCARLVKMINNHIKLLQGDDSVDKDDYLWMLFKNFVEQKKDIWINKKEIEFIRKSIVSKPSSKCAALATLFIDDDGKEGEYLQVLSKTMPSLKIHYAQEYIWTVDAEEIKKLKNGDTKNIVCNDYWDYFFGEPDDDDNMATFGGNMVAGYHENDEHQLGKQKMVGFYWRLSDIPDGFKSVMIDVEIYCPQIEFYIQFFDIKMSRGDDDNGASNTGHTSLFPMGALGPHDTFTWRIIMKPTLVQPDKE